MAILPQQKAVCFSGAGFVVWFREAIPSYEGLDRLGVDRPSGFWHLDRMTNFQKLLEGCEFLLLSRKSGKYLKASEMNIENPPVFGRARCVGIRWCRKND